MKITGLWASTAVKSGRQYARAMTRRRQSRRLTGHGHDNDQEVAERQGRRFAALGSVVLRSVTAGKREQGSQVEGTGQDAVGRRGRIWGGEELVRCLPSAVAILRRAVEL